MKRCRNLSNGSQKREVTSIREIKGKSEFNLTWQFYKLSLLNEENKLPIIIFDMNKEGNLKKLLSGESIGTKVDIEI